MNQCEYDKHAKCIKDDPCEGCETWAIAKRESEERIKKLLDPEVKNLKSENMLDIMDKISNEECFCVEDSILSSFCLRCSISEELTYAEDIIQNCYLDCLKEAGLEKKIK